jgi:2-polyprenyl-6-methoxyphenol hydroxylase-like FAD-dependent oxidoreductase
MNGNVQKVKKHSSIVWGIVLECKSEPSKCWRAPSVHARTLEMLARHGMSEAFLAAGYPIKQISSFYHGQLKFGIGFQNSRTEFPMLLACSQINTERILRDKFADLNVPIHWSHEFISYEFVDSHVLAKFKKTDSNEQETREFSYMVGCDGGRSRVRKAIGAVFEGEVLDLIITICDVHVKLDWQPTAW